MHVTLSLQIIDENKIKIDRKCMQTFDGLNQSQTNNQSILVFLLLLFCYHFYLEESNFVRLFSNEQVLQQLPITLPVLHKINAMKLEMMYYILLYCLLSPAADVATTANNTEISFDSRCECGLSCNVTAVMNKGEYCVQNNSILLITSNLTINR